jgi:hypothetical protein
MLASSRALVSIPYTPGGRAPDALQTLIAGIKNLHVLFAAHSRALPAS